MTSTEQAYALYLRANALHAARRRPAEAERLYRAAIAEGFEPARYNLGSLLRDVGRATEAEAMLAAAASTEDQEVASRAALALAKWLDLGRGEPDAARRFYRTALDLGRGRVRDEAALSLALLYAAARDRGTTTALLHYVTKRRYRRAGVEPIGEDSGLRFARALGALLTWPPAHGSARFNRRACYRARLLRRRRALARGSARA